MSCYVFINFVAYLISCFYRKKIEQRAPTTGFVVAMVFGILYSATLVGAWPVASYTMEMIRIFLLLACTSGSTWASLTLYFTMKRVRK
ncbi:MAG: hypothetical protein GF363_05720 [Chitinivibrionales bacterium]|nr:hypothetical protein [Chitinivibrionales bacterium]